uniref:Cytochrome c oxidase subunit 2 n=1 Tax=Stygobromus indentatus TaxID=1678292 RepID=A0A172QHB6_9CRUS|nr:cytochrome c oxidase subunit II [Stygobromus indentatus]AND97081.1 cytochrome c oxidase subunit II [Stygobromus indentatus]
MPTWSAVFFQDSSSPFMEQLTYFHDFTMAVLTLITTLVGLNLAFISYYNLSNRHLLQDQTIEMVWTVSPVTVLLSIALPSLQVLYLLDDPFNPSLSVKTIGHQWYWSYEYSDFPKIEFDSYMNSNNSNNLPRLLDADNSVVLPSNTQVRVVATAADVIHAWTVPSLGVKADAVPGRLNQLMFLLSRPGMFFGQCSEICGANHSFMPIKLESCPMNSFIKWAMSY